MVCIPVASIRNLAERHVEPVAMQAPDAASLIRARVRKAPAGARSKSTCLQLVVSARGGGESLPEARTEFVVHWGKGRSATAWRMTVGRSPGNPVWFHNRILPHDDRASRVDVATGPCTTAALLERLGYGLGDSVVLHPGPAPGTFQITRALQQARGVSRGSDADGRIDIHRDHSLQVPRVRPRIGKKILHQAPTLIRRYNRGQYLGRANPVLDAEGYERFANGPARDLDTLIDDLAYVGRFYGGTKESLLPGGSWSVEARHIAEAILDGGCRYRRLLAEVAPLDVDVPSVQAAVLLLAPFHATRSWMVWGTKVLHFLVPTTFPQLDAGVEAMLGLSRNSYEAHYYVGFMDAYRQVLEQFAEKMQRLRDADVASSGESISVSDIKLLDKVLYEAARERRRAAAMNRD